MTLAVPQFTPGTAPSQADLKWVMSSKPLAFFRQTSAQSGIASGTGTVVTLGTSVLDRYGMKSGNQIRIGLELGWYRVSGLVFFATQTGGTYRSASIALNGFDILGSAQYISWTGLGSGPTSVNTGPLLVQATASSDYIELKAQQDSGATMSTYVSSPRASQLFVEYVGTA